MKKRGISNLITVLLLILLAMAVIVIIWIIVRGVLEKEGEVMEIRQKLLSEKMSIKNVRFEDGNAKITLQRGGGKVNVSTEDIPEDPPLDIILVSDVSGSMGYCEGEEDIIEGSVYFTNDGELYCGTRVYVNATDCDEEKISVLKNAEQAFVRDVLENSYNTKIGVIEYSSANTVKRIDKPDLRVSLYVGVDPGCYEPDWFKINYVDNSWEDYNPSLAVSSCTECKHFFRKEFDVPDIEKVSAMTLFIAHDDGAVCFLNGEEVFFDGNAGGASYWNEVQTIPINSIKETGNVLACSVSNRLGVWGFDAALHTNRGILIEQGETWKHKSKFDCEASYNYGSNPKSIRARENWPTDFKFYATIRNLGATIDKDFDVKFRFRYHSGSEIVTVDGLEAYGAKTVEFDWDREISGNYEYLYAKVDQSNIISEYDESNNEEYVLIPVYTYSEGVDLKINGLTTSGICEPDGNPVDIQATIYNAGSVDINAGEEFNVTFFNGSCSDELIGYITVNEGLEAEKSVTKYLNWPEKVKENTKICAIVDLENSIPENDETNNNKTGITIEGWPELRAHYNFMALTEPVCERGDVIANFRAVTYNYGQCVAGESDIGVSTDNVDWSNKQPLEAVSVGSYSLYKYFDVPIYIDPKQDSFILYSRVDIDNQVIESGGTAEGSLSNLASEAYNVGPDLYFGSGDYFKITPYEVEEGSETTFTLTVKYRNSQCSIGYYNVSFYKDSISPENLIGSERTNNPSATISIDYTTTLIEDTTFRVFLDSENEIDEYSESSSSNQKSATVEVNPSIPLSPPLTSPDLSLFLGFLGVVGSCPVSGTDVDFEDIIRSQEISDNEAEIVEFIKETEAWWGTCICCGIMEAIDMFEAGQKVLILMSDGIPNDDKTCGLAANGRDAALEAANKARDGGIVITSVGFGDDSDESLLKEIATITGGEYYSAEESYELGEIYRQIAGGIISKSRAIKTFQYLSILIYDINNNVYREDIPFSNLPGPIETKEFTIDLDALGIVEDEIKRIEIHAIAIADSGKEVASQKLDSYDF